MKEYYVILKSGATLKIKAYGLTKTDIDNQFPFCDEKGERNKEVLIKKDEIAAIILSSFYSVEK